MNRRQLFYHLEMYLRSDERHANLALDFSYPQKFVVLILLIPTLLLGLYFTPLVQLAQASVKIFGTP